MADPDAPPARYTIGAPKDGSSPRLEALSREWTVSWLEVPVAPSFRDAVWGKLLGNASLSMVCVLAGATNGDAICDPGALRLIRVLMAETRAVGEAIGVRLAPDAEDRLIVAVRTSTHKPSTLVDLERGRRMEIDAILGAVCEIGRMAKVPTPTLDMIYSLVRLRAEEAGCYPANPSFSLTYDTRSELPVT